MDPKHLERAPAWRQTTFAPIVCAIFSYLALSGCRVPYDAFEDRFSRGGARPPVEAFIFTFENVRSNHDPDTLESRQSRRRLEDVSRALADLRPGDSKERVHEIIGDPFLYAPGFWVYFDVDDDGRIAPGRERADGISETPYILVEFEEGRLRAHDVSAFAMEVGAGG